MWLFDCDGGGGCGGGALIDCVGGDGDAVQNVIILQETVIDI